MTAAREFPNSSQTPLDGSSGTSMIGPGLIRTAAVGLILILGVFATRSATAEAPPQLVRPLSVEAGEPAMLSVWNRPILNLTSNDRGTNPE
jgi:hypothetical protein